MRDDNGRSITDLLAFAATHVVPTPGREPWGYGWAFPDYRHSDRAALEGCDGPVTFSDSGISAFEEAVTRLLKEQKIRARWDIERFWGDVASMVVTAFQKSDINKFIDRYVASLRTVGPTLTVQLIANVVWNQPPMLIGNTVLGNANMIFMDFVNSSAGKRPRISGKSAEKWLYKEVQPRISGEGDGPPAAMACWTVSQATLAERESERNLRDIVDLTILLEHDLQAYKVYHRGGTNRPGARNHSRSGGYRTRSY